MSEQFSFTISGAEMSMTGAPGSHAQAADTEAVQGQPPEETTREFEALSADSVIIFGFLGAAAFGPYLGRFIRDKYLRTHETGRPHSIQ